MFTAETKIRVRYGETDQMGYCYYGNYAQFFEIGRVETLRDLGFSYKSMENSGVMLPVVEFSVKYIKPALYDDLLTIKTTIREMPKSRIFFDYEILNEKGELVSTATTTLVFISKETMRPILAPAYFLEALKKLL